MNINEAFPSNYLKADVDVPYDGNLVLTIADCQLAEIGDDSKPVLAFEEVDKGLVLNKTNANAIVEQYGAETDAWVGKKISLYAKEVEFQGKTVLGIRVRLRLPKAGEEMPTEAPADHLR